jgi:endopeptidase Clp ATP-binding regulatory subunit ClpX
MSDEPKPENELSELERELKDVLRRAHISIANLGVLPGLQPKEPPAPDVPDSAKRLAGIKDFSLKPRDIRDYLDRFVIRQDEAKKVLSVAVCDHYNHVRRCLADPEFATRDYAKHNIVLLGPTGVGKTYLVRCIAKLVGVPFVKADATKFSETGYVGRDVEDLVRDLVKAADGDADLAQYGIIYLDEVDKIAAAPMEAGRDVSGRGVQVNLLKLMEETDVNLVSQTDLLGQMQAVFEMQRGKGPGKRLINTRHILFIVSGAFDRLAEQVKRRVESSPIGFAAPAPGERAESHYLRQAQTRDLVQYGFEPEFVGRLPVRVVCDPLSVEDLEQILLKSEGNVLEQYRQDFAGYQIEMNLSSEAIRRIAEKAHAEKTGARGLMTVMERIFRDFKFETPSTAVRRLDLDREAVDEPAESLRRLLEDKEAMGRATVEAEILEFAAAFTRETGIVLAFSKGASDLLVDLSLKEGKPARSLCRERFRDLEYGVRLIARNTGSTQFTVTKKLAADPAAELSKAVAASFKDQE